MPSLGIYAKKSKTETKIFIPSKGKAYILKDKNFSGENLSLGITVQQVDKIIEQYTDTAKKLPDLTIKEVTFKSPKLRKKKTPFLQINNDLFNSKYFNKKFFKTITLILQATKTNKRALVLENNTLLYLVNPMAIDDLSDAVMKTYLSWPAA